MIFIYMWTFVTCIIMIPVSIDFRAPFVIPFLVVSGIKFFIRMLHATVDWIIQERIGQWNK